MPTPDELIAILERMLTGDRTTEAIAQLGQWLKVNGDTLQYVSENGKFITNIGQVQGGDFHIGDRTYSGTDAETIKQILFEYGLIKDKLPGFEKLECEIPQIIYPVLIHAKYQQLVKKIRFHQWSRYSQSPPPICFMPQSSRN